MPKYNFDPTRVLLFPPPCPNEQLRRIYNEKYLDVRDEFPKLSTEQRCAVALRRMQEDPRRPKM
jgi:hypothetical protein